MDQRAGENVVRGLMVVGSIPGGVQVGARSWQSRVMRVMGCPRKRGLWAAPGEGRDGTAGMRMLRGGPLPCPDPSLPLQCDGAVPPGVRPGLREWLVRGARPLPLPLWLCRTQLLHGVSLQPPQRVCRRGGPRPLPALPQPHQGGPPGLRPCPEPPPRSASLLCGLALHPEPWRPGPTFRHLEPWSGPEKPGAGLGMACPCPRGVRRLWGHCLGLIHRGPAVE